MEPQGAPTEDLVDLLGHLHDIVLPPPVSMFPATWGWVVVGLVLLALLALAAFAWRRHRRATAYRRAALAELRGLAPALERGEAGAFTRLDALLRRTALAAFPRAEVAALTGDAWAAFLDRTGGRFGLLGPALAEAPYAPRPTLDGAAAARAARDWIAGHHA